MTLDLGLGSPESRDGAWARGWGILSSNWLVASRFITGKEDQELTGTLNCSIALFLGQGATTQERASGNREYKGVVWSLCVGQAC